MQQPIFLSLGSNYSLWYALLAIKQLFRPDAAAVERARKQLDVQFGGNTRLYYTGRDAIEQALIAVQRKHSQQLTVFTQAATCYAIEEAITKAGCRPVYVDVGKQRLNMVVSTLDAAYTKAGSPRHAVVIVQHLLGFPAAIERIAAWCAERNIVLIEDLAQSFGALTASGKQVGSLGDIVVGSFGRDKILDTVHGGFAVVRNSAVAPHPKQFPVHVQSKQLVADLLYPITAWKVRKFFRVGLGPILYRLARAVGIFTSPIPAPLSVASGLPLEFGRLLSVQLHNLDSQLLHRRQVAQMYWSQLQPWLRALHLHEVDFQRAVCVRVPLLVPDVVDFIAYLRTQRVYASDRWYRAAVDMGSFQFPTVYQPGMCPHAEFLTQHVCNLPTHLSLSLAQAERVARVVQQYLIRPEVLTWYKDVLNVEIHS